MINGDFVVSGDGHLLEPTDLFRTRLPRHLRDRAVWEEDFEVEPLVDGVAAQVLHPNLSLFGLYSDDHELSMAHARVYTDYVVERFTPYFSRLAPTAPIPITDVDDAVAQIEKGAPSRFLAVLLPATPPKPHYP